MKKLIISLVVLVIMTAVYAEDDGNLFKISMLLDTNRLSDAALYEISSLASSLDSTEKMLLLSQHEKGAWGPFAANLILGLGIGSFFQGDYTSGTIALLGELIGVSMIMYPTTDSAVATGMLLFFGSRLYEVIAPFVYAGQYNKKVKSALMGVNIRPEPVDDTMGIKLAASFSF